MIQNEVCYEKQSKKKVLNRVSRKTGEDPKHAYEDTFVFVAKHAL